MNQGQIMTVDSYTKLLLSMNGIDASTYFEDSGVTGHTVTAVGNAQLDTDFKKFGSASGMFDGTGDYLTIPAHTDFDFSGGVWTIDAWIYYTGAGTANFIYAQTLGLNAVELAVTSTKKAYLLLNFSDIFQIVLDSGINQVPLNTWTHITAVENGDNYYLFINGVLKASTSNSHRLTNVAINISIGKYYNGWLDELRVSKGIARWTANFTPPTNEYMVLTGTILNKDTTYTESELPELQFAQSADILFITHPNHLPAKLVRTSHIAWTLSDIQFIKKYYPSSSTLASSFNNFNAANCVDDNVGTKAWDNDIDIANEFLQLSCGATNARELLKIAIFIKDAELNAVFDIEYQIDTTWYSAYTGWSLIGKGLGWVEIEWPSVGAHANWRLTKTNAAVVGGSVMEIEFYETGKPTEWTSGKYPACVTFFEERLWLAYLQTVWSSKSADFFNLTFGTKDDDALQYTIGSNRVNKIQWLSPGKILIIGTSGNEFKVSASSLDEAITPLNIRIVNQSTYGSAYHEAFPINEVTLFITKSLRKIREFTYSFENDTYVSPDLTLLAGHLFNYDIKSMAFQQEPYSCLWVVMADGRLLGFTYQRLEGITAWHRHTTDGYFESVACIPNTIGKGYNELWTVVKRNIGGSDVRYIEMMEANFDGESLNSNDVFFVDSGLSYDGVPTSTISGLAHLNGKTVAILADGLIQTSKLVAGGSISLDIAASKVNVGLPYTSILQTMRIERKDYSGTAQGRKKRINQVVFRLYKTKQFKYGSTPEGTLKEKIFDTMYTGDYEVDFPLGWDKEGYITIIHDKPLPCTVVAVIPELEVN